MKNGKTPKAKKPIYKRIWFWVVVVIVVAVIGSAIGGGGKDKSGTSTSTSSSSKIKTAEPKKETATPISFEQMNKDYVSNGAAADDKYKGKLLEFQGKVSSVTANPIKGTDVTIEAGNFTDNQFQDTKAKVNVNDEMAKQLTSGQTYTFQAKGDGVMMSDGWVMYLDFNNGVVK
ncbi:OB-fold protein [Lactococcus lactis]|uniref:OB-fold protein n=1 Tax=Lactococcus lactis TaxID=1358 RepID=UPI00071C4796|nr:hypothetical protein [Lactococcus lactis]KSU21980.1 Phage protein [Lactococcus lactis subsp. lactis]